jgi:multiple sugar transport system permease protein
VKPPAHGIRSNIIGAAYALLVLGMIFPIYWLIITSLKPGYLTQTNPPVFFTREITLANYAQVVHDDTLRFFFLNSAIVALGTTLVTVLIGSLAAFSLSKPHLSYGLRRGVLTCILLVRVFPPIVVGIPYFTLLQRAGLTDTRLGLLLTHVSLTIPFVVWLMVGFFQDIPEELDTAAMIDGCSMWRRFWQIGFPLVGPGVAVTAIFAFIISWNEYLFASILTSFNAKTLPVAIATFIGERRLEWGPMSALGTFMLVFPALCAFIGQRYIVQGLTFGAVKE